MALQKSRLEGASHMTQNNPECYVILPHKYMFFFQINGMKKIKFLLIFLRDLNILKLWQTIQKKNFVLWMFKISHLLYMAAILHFTCQWQWVGTAAYSFSPSTQLILVFLWLLILRLLVHVFCVTNNMEKNRYQFRLNGK